MLCARLFRTVCVAITVTQDAVPTDQYNITKKLVHYGQYQMDFMKP